MESFQEYLTELNTILDQGRNPGNDTRSKLDDFFEKINKNFNELIEKSDSPANSNETKYQFYQLLVPAFQYYSSSQNGRMHDDRRKLETLQKNIGRPLKKQIDDYRISQQAIKQKASDELRRKAVELEQSVSNLFQFLASFNLPNVSSQHQSNADELIVRTAFSSSEHKILGVDSGGHSTIECRKKDGASVFFGFYVHEPAEAHTLQANLMKKINLPSNDRKVLRFVELKDDHLKKYYEGHEIHIPCEGLLDIDKAETYLLTNKFTDFDPATWAPRRGDYRLYSQNCSTFVREALIVAQGENPLPYDGVLWGLDTPMAVHAYAQQLRDKVLFEQAKKIRKIDSVEHVKTCVIQAIEALEKLDMTDAAEHDRLFMRQLIQRLSRMVSFPDDIPFLYEDMQLLLGRIQSLETNSLQLQEIRRILLTASQLLPAYYQRVDFVSMKTQIAAAMPSKQSEIQSLKSFPDAVRFINQILSDAKTKDASTDLSALESIRGKLYEQIYFQRDAKYQSDFIKQINHWILPNMLFEEVQPTMPNLVEMAIKALSIPASEPFHQKEGQIKRELQAKLNEQTSDLPAKLIAIQQTMNAHAPWWVRWLPRSVLSFFSESLSKTQERFEQLENQARLLCVMDAFVKGKIMPDEWELHMDQFKDWLSVETVNSWKKFVTESSYSKMSNQLGLRSQIVPEKPPEQMTPSVSEVHTPASQADLNEYENEDEEEDHFDAHP